MWSTFTQNIHLLTPFVWSSTSSRCVFQNYIENPSSGGGSSASRLSRAATWFPWIPTDWVTRMSSSGWEARSTRARFANSDLSSVCECSHRGDWCSRACVFVQTVPRTLSPQWREQFDFHLYEDSGGELEITVWDKDTGRRDDFIGRLVQMIDNIQAQVTCFRKTSHAKCVSMTSFSVTSGTL